MKYSTTFYIIGVTFVKIIFGYIYSEYFQKIFYKTWEEFNPTPGNDTARVISNFRRS